MKIVQVVVEIEDVAGGVAYCVPRLCGELAERGVEVELHTLRKGRGEWPFVVREYPMRGWPAKLGRSPVMLRGLREGCKRAQIIHGNNLWTMPAIYPAWARRGTECKLVMSTHGALSEWSRGHSRWKKRLVGWLGQYRALREADMLHATSEKEYREIRAMGLRQPVMVVPVGVSSEAVYTQVGSQQSAERENAVLTQRHRDREAQRGEGSFNAEAQRRRDGEGEEILTQRRGGAEAGRECLGALVPECFSGEEGLVVNKTFRHSDIQTFPKKVVFLGRLHRVKGLDYLVEAWGEVERENREWELVIAGPDRGALRELRELVAKLALEKVVFMGEVEGAEKESLFASADVVVLPSRSENFGVTVAEALVRGIPVVASSGTPWSELDERGAGFYVPVGVEGMKRGLREVMRLSDEERREMGGRGREWAEREFDWAEVGRKTLAAYEWLVGGGERPEWVWQARSASQTQ